MIRIHTDGACTNNGKFKGTGGWSYIIESEEAEFANAEPSIDTTNNRMEIVAVIEAFKQILDTQHIFSEKEVMLFSDSDLVIKTLKGDFRQKKNLDLWATLFRIVELLEELGFDLKYMWIPRKSNHQADALARKVRDKLKKQIKKSKGDYIIWQNQK